jgi:hypothetical protein
MSTKTNKGFTILEMVIYIALFSIIIGGGMTAAYQIISGGYADTNHVILQEEANFLMRKIDWAVGDNIASILNATRLQATKGSQTFTFNFCNSKDLTIELGSGKTCSNSPIILNSSSIKVSGLTFSAIGTNGIKTAFTLTTSQNGRNASEDFSTTKYLRK